MNLSNKTVKSYPIPPSKVPLWDGKNKKMVTQELLKEIFEYKNGVFYYKKKIQRRVPIGSIAGCLNIGRDKRWVIKVNRKHYRRSQLVFLYHKGYIPKLIDHIDRDSLNDIMENLREATISQNGSNRASSKNGTSKYIGVSLHTNKKWVAAITFNKKTKYLGIFKTEQEAALTYNKAAIKHHGEFANLNIIKIWAE